MPLHRFHGVIVFLTIGSLALGIGPVWAAPQGPWALCGAAFRIPTKPHEASSTAQLHSADPGEIRLSAESADIVEGERTSLSGNVLMEKGLETLAADFAVYDQLNERLEAEGNVQYWEGELYLSGTRALADFSIDQIDVDNAAFLDLPSHGRGDAGTLRISGSELIRIRDGTYTTCNPGDADWMLEARKLDLDRENNVGTARDVKVRFKDYPIFYSPYLTFPISNARKSGFLFPSFRLSGDAGTEVTIPYYFNIAPNQDATFNARLTTTRGAALGGEYRYLQPWGFGELDAEVLPYDSEYGGTRGLVKFRHESEVAYKWRAELHYDRVSDRDYFSDLGDSLEVSSTSHLRQRANFDYYGGSWWARARAESFQTVDGTLPGAGRPYKRLPQLFVRSSLPESNRRLNLDYYGEYVHFDRKDSVVGHRLDLLPSVSFPVRSAGWFVVPKVSLRYTTYALDNQAAESDRSPDRLIPSFSVDSGMFFERNVTLGGRGFINTLEPRMFYLAVPFKDQRELPLFDTGQFTFNFDQLFREERFSGADRIGDAHQVAIALTSRLLDPTSGQELFRASVGQLQYFRDRSVTLSSTGLPDRRRSSDIVAEVAAQVGPAWSVKAGVQWNIHDERTEKNALSLRYKPDETKVVNLTYRFFRGTVEQADASFRWPWRHNLNLVGRMNYSLADNRILETFGGIEYESCCWAFRAVGRRFLTNDRGGYNNGVFLQLELKGLAGIGQKAGAFLERSIPGYQNNF